MKILRTPDECFVGLADYPFKPHWTEIDSGEGEMLRLHFVDEGPRDQAPVLLMHGEPSWSYLYRHMITGLVGKGHRVVAPDLIGFGKSDKPAEQSDYTYARHVAWMSAWLKANDLEDITLFCQDWCGLIGLRFQYVPEFDAAYSAAKHKEITAEKQAVFRKVWTDLLENEDVAVSNLVYYDTKVFMKGDYDAYLEGTARRVGKGSAEQQGLADAPQPSGSGGAGPVGARPVRDGQRKAPAGKTQQVRGRNASDNGGVDGR